MSTEYYCGYCGGDVLWSDENVQFEHTDDGERVDPPVPGDYVSAAHNRKGSRVNPADVQSRGERDAEDEGYDANDDGPYDDGADDDYRYPGAPDGVIQA